MGALVGEPRLHIVGGEFGPESDVLLLQSKEMFDEISNRFLNHLSSNGNLCDSFYSRVVQKRCLFISNTPRNSFVCWSTLNVFSKQFFNNFAVTLFE